MTHQPAKDEHQHPGQTNCHCDDDGQCKCADGRTSRCDEAGQCANQCESAGGVHGDKELQEKIARLERQSQEHLDSWKRAKADYLNLKRDSEKAQQEIGLFARGAAVIQFLPIYENLKRAIKHVPAEQKELDWAKGLTHIQRQFEEALKSMGIEPIATEGQPFDHNLHHAVRKVKVDGMKSDLVVEELKSGFKIGDKVLEPAQVTVSE